MLRAPGQALDRRTQAFFEPRLGTDLSRVRVHTGRAAADSARRVDALAYTVGQHIVFGAGAYAPGTGTGRRLLAHELAHVRQQSGLASGSLLQRSWQPCAGSEDCPDRDEGELDRTRGIPFGLEPLTTMPGWIVYPFPVGGDDASALADNPDWQFLMETLASGTARWQLLGVTDCEGSEAANAELRERRAQAVARQIPLEGQVFLDQVAGAPIGDCIDNDLSEWGRAVNRSVVLLKRDLPPPDRPPLRGDITEATGFFVRSAPGKASPIIGKLSYEPMRVTILEGSVVPDEGVPIKDLWYKVEFSEPDFQQVVLNYSLTLLGGSAEKRQQHDAALKANQGNVAWIGQAAFAVAAMPWDQFLNLLQDFEDAHPEPVNTQLSRLRQIGEESDVPGNEAVGAGQEISDPINRDERAPVSGGGWQLLLESKQVELPNGDIIDIHHFLLGVESLIDDGRRSESRDVSMYGVSTNIGQSYAAATWSGDVGAAAGDMVMHKSPDWEQAGPMPREPNELVAFYFRTRAPDFDLLADLDAWGAFELMPAGKVSKGKVGTLVELVTRAYGDRSATPEETRAAIKANRARGIRNLLLHYGFDSAEDLLTQRAAVARMQEQVFIFSMSWYQLKYTPPKTGIGPVDDLLEAAPPQRLTGAGHAAEAELAEASRQMNEVFLLWLERQAKENGVTLY